MKIHENLEQFKEYKFFNTLNEVDDPKKEKTPKDPKAMQDEKEANQAQKDAMDVVKKAKDNFARFKSAAGSKIQAYANFWKQQEKATNAVKEKDSAISVVYSLYDSDFLVVLKNVEGQTAIMVIKANLEEGEENPFFSARSESAIQAFKEFYSTLKKDMLSVKNNHVKTVENKKREEQQKVKRDKLNKFLQA